VAAGRDIAGYLQRLDSSIDEEVCLFDRLYCGCGMRGRFAPAALWHLNEARTIIVSRFF
jgi:hypothetical protein